MKKIILCLLLLTGCYSPEEKAAFQEKCKADYESRVTRTELIVKSKTWVEVSEGGFSTPHRQQIVVTDPEGNEYRFAAHNGTMEQYNKLMVGKKYLIKSECGYLHSVEEIP